MGLSAGSSNDVVVDQDRSIDIDMVRTVFVRVVNAEAMAEQSAREEYDLQACIARALARMQLWSDGELKSCLLYTSPSPRDS